MIWAWLIGVLIWLAACGAFVALQWWRAMPIKERR